MTWNKGLTRLVSTKRLLELAVIVAASGAVTGCSGCDSDSPRKGLSVVVPAADAELTRADDIDEETPGVQLDVMIESRGLPEGAQVELYAGGDEESLADGLLDADGKTTFAGVTLPPGVRRIYVQTSAGTVRSDEDQEYTLRVLEITNPDPGVQRRDASSTKDGFQLAVTVEAFAVEGDISLRVGEEVVGDPVAQDETGKALFTIDLDPGEHVLDAISGDISSDPVTVEVLSDNGVTPRCTAIELVTPAVPDGADSLTFGGDQCPTDDAFATDFTFSTDAGDGRVATLKVNDQVVGSADIKGTLVTFKEVVLDRRDSANRLALSIDTEDGDPCELDVDIDFLVDCAGPTCSIVSPTPVAIEKDGDTTLYLNASIGDGNFDIGVETSDEAVGQTVQLIVDGNSRNPAEVTAVKDGNDGAATFNNLSLVDGAHTLEARCVDGNGNTTFSAVRNWTVDVTPCSLEITSPAADTIFSAADDDDSTTDGTQILVDATVGGNDCDDYRAGPCDPATGLSGDTNPFTGAPLSVTLDDTMAMQDLCVEIIDAAGNSTSDDVPVTFYASAPSLAILSPTDGALYNALGNDGTSQAYEADENTGTTTCEATIRVQCSAIGSDVKLMRGDAGSEVEIGTAACQTPGSGDTDVASGQGIAVFSELDFLMGLATTSTRLLATQAVSTGSGDLSGTSDAITIGGDCNPPAVPTSPLLLPPTGSTVLGTCPQFAIAVAPTGDANRLSIPSAPEASRASLTVTPVGSTTANAPLTVNKTGVGFVFSNVVIGDGSTEGSATLELVLTDAFENNTTLPTCTASVLTDVPVINNFAISTPPGTTMFDLPTDVAPCENVGGNQYRVPVTIEVDQLNNRGLAIMSNGGMQMVDLGAASTTTIQVCADIPEGNSDIAAVLSSLNNSGAVLGSTQSTVSVSLRTLRIDTPTPGRQYTGSAASCTPGAYEARINAAVDQIYPNGTPATISVDGGTAMNTTVMGSLITMCVPLSDGPHTLTVTIPSSGATASVDVEMSAGDLTGEQVTNIMVTTPPADSMGGTDVYRTTPLQLSWTLPSGTFFWQEYQLRCSPTPLTVSDDPTDWWNNVANPVPAQQFSVTPPTESGGFDLPVGKSSNCVLRACNTTSACTMLPTTSFAVSKPFRYQRITPPVVDADSPNFMGANVVPVGDVNGDGIGDVLAGGGVVSSATDPAGTEQIYLYFGRDMSPPHSVDPTADAPDVALVKERTLHEIYRYGTRLAGLGDINGDGRDDFAIAAPAHCTGCGPFFNNAQYGAVYIFFGRSSTAAWGSSLDLNEATPCQADVCIYGDAKHLLNLGRGLVGVGRFDSDALNDVAIGASGGGDNSTGDVYIISGAWFQGLSCTADTSCSVIKRLPADAADFTGYRIQGNATTDMTAPNRWLGANMAAVGNVDNVAGDDLVILDGGNSTIAAKIFLLSGREFSTMSGLQTIANSDLVTIATTSSPTNFQYYGYRLAALSNVYDPSSGTPGLSDLAVYTKNDEFVQVLPGDQSSAGFSTSSGIRLSRGNNGGEISVSAGEFPALGLVDSVSGVDRHLDLDGDGLGDVCMGTRQSGSPGAPPGSVFELYGYEIEGTPPGTGSVLSTKQINITPPAAATDTYLRVTNYVGDVTGDGEPDLAVGDSPDDTASTSKEGGLWILY